MLEGVSEGVGKLQMESRLGHRFARAGDPSTVEAEERQPTEGLVKKQIDFLGFRPCARVSSLELHWTSICDASEIR